MLHRVNPLQHHYPNLYHRHLQYLHKQVLMPKVHHNRVHHNNRGLQIREPNSDHLIQLIKARSHKLREPWVKYMPNMGKIHSHNYLLMRPIIILNNIKSRYLNPNLGYSWPKYIWEINVSKGLELQILDVLQPSCPLIRHKNSDQLERQSKQIRDNKLM